MRGLMTPPAEWYEPADLIEMDDDDPAPEPDEVLYVSMAGAVSPRPLPWPR